MIMYHYI